MITRRRWSDLDVAVDSTEVVHEVLLHDGGDLPVGKAGHGLDLLHHLLLSHPLSHLNLEPSLADLHLNQKKDRAVF